MGLGAPTDPAYLRFLDGLKDVAADPTKTGAWRWHPRDAKWYTYAPAEWGMEDLGLADTAPEFAITQNWGFPNSTYEVSELHVPDLFERVKKAAATYRQRYSKANLVWSPWGGGDWRSAFKRTATPPPPNGGGTPQPPPDCVQRVEQVREWRRRGYITIDQERSLVKAIVAECTGASS